MGHFFDTDAVIVVHPRLQIHYVEYDGSRVPYSKVLKYLKQLVKEQDLPIDEITLKDVSRAYNEEILSFILNG